MSYPHLTAHPALPVPNTPTRSLQPAVLTLVLLSAIPTLITIAAGAAVFAFSMTWQPGDESLLLPFLGIVALGLLAAAALMCGLVGGGILAGLRRFAWYAAMPGAVQGLLAFLTAGVLGTPIMFAMYQL